MASNGGDLKRKVRPRVEYCTVAMTPTTDRRDPKLVASSVTPRRPAFEAPVTVVFSPKEPYGSARPRARFRPSISSSISPPSGPRARARRDSRRARDAPRASTPRPRV